MIGARARSVYLVALPAGVAALLGAAAFFKAATPEPSRALLGAVLGTGAPGWWVLALATGELALGVALLLPASRRAAVLAAAGFFAGSIAVLLYARQRGHAEGCGCFGRFSPSVSTTVLLDGALLAALGLWSVLRSEGRDSHEAHNVEGAG